MHDFGQHVGLCGPVAAIAAFDQLGEFSRSHDEIDVGSPVSVVLAPQKRRLRKPVKRALPTFIAMILEPGRDF